MSKAICSPTCVHGNCIAPNQCSCNSGWGSSTCNQCTNGYYPKDSGNCLQCSDCNNHGICSDGPSGTGQCTCNTGYTTPDGSNDYCSSCSHGYVMQDSTCIKCYEICETCEFNSTYCTSYLFLSFFFLSVFFLIIFYGFPFRCKSGYVLQPYNNTCTTSCSDGTYFDTSSCTRML